MAYLLLALNSVKVKKCYIYKLVLGPMQQVNPQFTYDVMLFVTIYLRPLVSYFLLQNYDSKRSGTAAVWSLEMRLMSHLTLSTACTNTCTQEDFMVVSVNAISAPKFWTATILIVIVFRRNDKKEKKGHVFSLPHYQNCVNSE